jgi:hypothetical protein
MKKSLLIIGLTLLSFNSFAGVPASFTYQGIVMNSAGTAPLTSVVSLKLSLYDPTGTCLLYQEQQANIDLSQTNGTFAVQVGSAVGAAKRVGGTDQGLAMTTVFANNGQILAASTSGCTAGYTPAANDGRLLRVAVTNGGSTVTISPDLQINSVPNALVAETLQGLTPANVIKSQSGSISTNASSAWRVESSGFSGVCTSSPCSIINGTGLCSSITRGGTGGYTCSFSTAFSATPTCTIAITANAAHQALIIGASATLASVETINFSGGLADSAFNLICQGPR